MPKPAVIHVVGNRPQFIKLAVLYPAIAKTGLHQVIVHTGQHASLPMSDLFFQELDIPRPDVQLQAGARHSFSFIGHMAQEMHQYFARRSPKDIVLVYGDTNTTLAAAMAARRCKLTLAHFEAGVRTADTAMPEEMNRVLTDRLSDILYCCTPLNLENLRSEGYGSSIAATVLLTGDLMYDAFQKIKAPPAAAVPRHDYILCTIHRAANIGNREKLGAIVSALNEIHRDTEVVMPLHPHTAKRLDEYGLKLMCTILQPLGYPGMKRLMADACAVITDSGGACREAFFAGKKSIIIMESPFWPEIIGAGAAWQTAATADAIVQRWHELDLLKPDFNTPLFGDGHASEKIASHLYSMFDKS